VKKFLIYISQPYSIPIGHPLQSEIEARGFQIKWFCDEEETKQHLAKEYLLNSVNEVMAYQPDVVLVATNVVPDFFSGIKVQIFHGFSVGKRSEAKGHFNIRGFFDLYCNQGESTTKPFLKLQKKHKYFEVVETGWSKVDPLFPLTPKKERTKSTIIISSTFTTNLSLAKNREVVEEIERLSKLGKYNFISVLHPKMEQEVVEKFKSFQNENFEFYDTTELIPLFKHADVMLSDTTSAITEFILQKKPVVTINNNQPKPHLIDIKEASRIEASLDYALEYPQKIMQEIDKFIAITHPYSDGKSSARVVDACLDFLENKRVKRKPLNLMRRFKIRKKLGYFKI
jgi:CDP-glycerol glycerophosphotransferase (TagB/SpsB family)